MCDIKIENVSKFSQERRVRKESAIILHPPIEFDFKECLAFLGRSFKECLHYVQDDILYKCIKVRDKILLLKVSSSNNKDLIIDILNNCSDEVVQEEVVDYIWDLFDLDTDLKLFYQMAEKDELLKKVIDKYYGLRIIGIPDLFEAIIWAIIGQQINLAFAYSLKRSFVENFGEKFIYNEEEYWLFPEPEVISKLSVSDLTKLKFTRRKAEYVIGVAQKMNLGELSKDDLLKEKDFEKVQKALLSLRGVGKWTANYVMMKCLNYKSAFPIEDVGLHNAIKFQLGLDEKPTIDEIMELSKEWTGWEAYATFYLWRSLYE